LLWYSTEKLWKAGERQYELTRRALTVSEDNTAAAETAAHAASEQARVARESFENLERPYLLATVTDLKPRYEDFRGSGVKGAYATVKIGNYGRTPAIVYTYSGVWKVEAEGVLPEIPYDELALGDFRNVYAILNPQQLEDGDGTDYSIPDNIDLSNKMNEGLRINIPGQELYFFVKVRFKDVTGIVRDSYYTWRLNKPRKQLHGYGGRNYSFDKIVADA
jgi:hypothetical protein